MGARCSSKFGLVIGKWSTGKVADMQVQQASQDAKFNQKLGKWSTGRVATC